MVVRVEDPAPLFEVDSWPRGSPVSRNSSWQLGAYPVWRQCRHLVELQANIEMADRRSTDLQLARIRNDDRTELRRSRSRILRACGGGHIACINLKLDHLSPKLLKSMSPARVITKKLRTQSGSPENWRIATQRALTKPSYAQTSPIDGSRRVENGAVGLPKKASPRGDKNRVRETMPICCFAKARDADRRAGHAQMVRNAVE